MSNEMTMLLNKAMEMSPSDRAMLANFLLTSIDEPSKGSVDEDWIKLIEKRHEEISEAKVKPVTWDEIKNRIASI